MSGFGAFAPMPMRLGGSKTEGWTAAQHARAVADRTALARASAFAWVTFHMNPAEAPPTLISYNGMPGMGASFAPVLTTFGGPGRVKVAWPLFYLDAYEVPQPFFLHHADATAHYSTQARITMAQPDLSRNTVDVFTFDSSLTPTDDATITLRVA